MDVELSDLPLFPLIVFIGLSGLSQQKCASNPIRFQLGTACFGIRMLKLGQVSYLALQSLI